MKDFTTITIKKETRDKLNTLKIHPRETAQEILERLIKNKENLMENEKNCIKNEENRHENHNNHNN